MNRFIFTSLFVSGILLSAGCSDFFETNPDDILLGDNYIADINEFYSGYLGVASKVQKVADHSIILSELRGDLLEPTENAPQSLWEIYNYTDDNNNEFKNPVVYYDIVINANDYLKKAIEYKIKNPNAISDEGFNAFISATIRFKVWTYLMIGKLYGKAVYYDDPMLEYNPKHTYPTLDFDALVQQLIQLMQTGITWEDKNGSHNVNGLIPFYFTDYLFPDGSADNTWNMINPNPDALKAELELWAGQYDQVIATTMNLLYANGDKKKYKITNDEYNGEWRELFYDKLNEREQINMFMFDYQNNQTNNLLKYFSKMEPNYYYLRPTQAAMNRFDAQYQKNGIDKGDIWRGKDRSYYLYNGQHWVFYKFIRDYETYTDRVYKTVNRIYMYRATDIHLFLAEALNQKGLFREADAVLNEGIANYTLVYKNSLRYPFNDPVINAAFVNNWGIRKRVNLKPAQPAADSIDTPELYKRQLDSLLIEETCLESAGEARSYFTMIRMAKRYNDPAIVADRVSAKYPEGKREEIRSYLMTPENWYIKYNLGK